MLSAERITLSERENAAKIVRKLREYYQHKLIAELLGLNKFYVSFAANMTKVKSSGKYILPEKACRKILEWAASRDGIAG